jgi:anti-sigma regulatory factor (Ser/Thr protein kinase)
MDQIEDLRLAVNEAFAFLVDETSNDNINITFTVDGSELAIVLQGPTTSQEPDRSSFGWTVLTALVNEVSSSRNDTGNVIIHLTAKAGVSA